MSVLASVYNSGALGNSSSTKCDEEVFLPYAYLLIKLNFFGYNGSRSRDIDLYTKEYLILSGVKLPSFTSAEDRSSFFIIR